MFGFIFYLIIICVVVYNVFYRKCPPNSALVLIDKTNPSQKILLKIITEGGAFVNPINQDFKILSFKQVKVHANLRNILTKSPHRININSTFIIAVSKKPAFMQNAALEIMDLEQYMLLNKAKEIITNRLKLVCATFTNEEILNDPNFLNCLEMDISSELKKIGMEVFNININDLTDNSDENKTQTQQTKKDKKKVQNPQKQSFEQEFNEIAKNEIEKIETEKQEINNAYNSIFSSESFDEFKSKTEQLSEFSGFNFNSESEQEQEKTTETELKEVLEKAVEKAEETIKEQKTEQTKSEQYPDDDIFASVRQYFENKNQ